MSFSHPHLTARNIDPCLNSPLLELKCILRNPFDNLLMEEREEALSRPGQGCESWPSRRVRGWGASRTSGVLEDRLSLTHSVGKSGWVPRPAGFTS